mgnify:CR=1 FL=1
MGFVNLQAIAQMTADGKAAAAKVNALAQKKQTEGADKAKAKAPTRSLVSIEDVGVTTAFLAHDAARLITGETLYIDGGYHIID